jgi:hypothetical protein
MLFQNTFPLRRPSTPLQLYLIRSFPLFSPFGLPYGSVDSRLPKASHPAGCLQQSPVRPPRRLGPHTCPGAWL